VQHSLAEVSNPPHAKRAVCACIWHSLRLREAEFSIAMQQDEARMKANDIGLASLDLI